MPHVIFQTTSQFSFSNFASLFVVIKQLICTFLAQTLYTLDKNSPWKWRFSDFWVPWWKFTKFLMLFLKPWVSSSSKIAWHFSVVKDNYSVTFRSHVIYFPQKGPIKVQITKTFECLDQNAPNSCKFLTTNCFFFKFFITLL